MAEYQESVHTAIRDVETGAVQVIRSDRKHPYFAQRLEDSGAVFNVAYAAPPPSSHGHVYKGPIPGGAWVDAQHLRPGDRLINADGSWAEVVSVRVEREDLTAYNLSVRDFESFFVAEYAWDDAVWVHNANCFVFTDLNTGMVYKIDDHKALRGAGTQRHHVNQRALFKQIDGWDAERSPAIILQGHASRIDDDHGKLSTAADDYLAGIWQTRTPTFAEITESQRIGMRAAEVPDDVIEEVSRRMVAEHAELVT